jgi:hypothetical protein
VPAEIFPSRPAASMEHQAAEACWKKHYAA